jgi:type I restriction enzyme S subunit
MSETATRITELGLNKSSARLLPPGSVLFSSRASIGKIAVAAEPMATNQGFANLIPRGGIDSYYLAYCLKRFVEQIRALGSGTTYLEVAKSELRRFKVPLAPFNEQRRIAHKIRALLQQLRTAKEALEKNRVLGKQLRQSILAKAFRGELTERNLNDEPAENLLKVVRQERQEFISKGDGLRKRTHGKPPTIDPKGLPQLPDGWIWTRLSEVCTKVQDGTHFSPPNSPDLKDGVPYVTAKNIKPQGIDLSNITYISRLAHDNIYRRCNPEKGDVLYIKDGATTGLAVVNELEFPFSVLSSVALLKPDRRLLNSHFLKHYLNSPETYKRLTGRMTGTAIKRIILERIRNAEFPLAPLDEQKAVVAIVEAAFEKAVIVDRNLQDANKEASFLEQAILGKAFRGKLVPQDPNDEPGTTLLDRIRTQRAIARKNKPDRKLEEFPSTVTTTTEV